MTPCTVPSPSPPMTPLPPMWQPVRSQIHRREEQERLACLKSTDGVSQSRREVRPISPSLKANAGPTCHHAGKLWKAVEKLKKTIHNNIRTPQVFMEVNACLTCQGAGQPDHRSLSPESTSEGLLLLCTNGTQWFYWWCYHWHWQGGHGSQSPQSSGEGGLLLSIKVTHRLDIAVKDWH